MVGTVDLLRFATGPQLFLWAVGAPFFKLCHGLIVLWRNTNIMQKIPLKMVFRKICSLRVRAGRRDGMDGSYPLNCHDSTGASAVLIDEQSLHITLGDCDPPENGILVARGSTPFFWTIFLSILTQKPSLCRRQK